MRTVNVNAIGEYIRQQREQAKISLRQLADAAGVSDAGLSEQQKQILLEIYESFHAETAAARPPAGGDAPEAAETAAGHGTVAATPAPGKAEPAAVTPAAGAVPPPAASG